MIFLDRQEAGRWLAAELEAYRSMEPVVLALPRGGVPVGYEVAHALGAVLDVFVVRKLGAPGHPEFAIGAVAPGGITVVDHATIEQLGVSRSYLAAVIERERAEVARRAEQFGAGESQASIAGKTVLIVDDGLATGATAEAAVDAARQQGAARVVVAAPVGAPEAVARVAAKADAVICLETPADFGAVGYWYRDFRQTTDAEVRELLRRARLEHTTGGVR